MRRIIFFCGIIIGMVLWAVCTRAYDFIAANPALSVGRTMTTDAKINAIYRILDKNYAGEYDKALAQEGAFEGLVDTLGDRYTVYMDA